MREPDLPEYPADEGYHGDISSPHILMGGGWREGSFPPPDPIPSEDSSPHGLPVTPTCRWKTTVVGRFEIPMPPALPHSRDAPRHGIGAGVRH